MNETVPTRDPHPSVNEKDSRNELHDKAAALQRSTSTSSSSSSSFSSNTPTSLDYQADCSSHSKTIQELNVKGSKPPSSNDDSLSSSSSDGSVASYAIDDISSQFHASVVPTVTASANAAAAASAMTAAIDTKMSTADAEDYVQLWEMCKPFFHTLTFQQDLIQSNTVIQVAAAAARGETLSENKSESFLKSDSQAAAHFHDSKKSSLINVNRNHVCNPNFHLHKNDDKNHGYSSPYSSSSMTSSSNDKSHASSNATTAAAAAAAAMVQHVQRLRESMISARRQQLRQGQQQHVREEGLGIGILPPQQQQQLMEQPPTRSKVVSDNTGSGGSNYESSTKTETNSTESNSNSGGDEGGADGGERHGKREEKPRGSNDPYTSSSYLNHAFVHNRWIMANNHHVSSTHAMKKQESAAAAAAVERVTNEKNLPTQQQQQESSQQNLHQRLAVKKRKRLDQRREHEEAGQYAFYSSPSLSSSWSSEFMTTAPQESDSSTIKYFKPVGRPITLDEALSFTHMARIVVMSVPPFLIVHANAAFYRLTGINASHVVVNQPLSSLISLPDTLGYTRSMMRSTMPFEDEQDTMPLDKASGDYLVPRVPVMNDPIDIAMHSILATCGHGDVLPIHIFASRMTATKPSALQSQDHKTLQDGYTSNEASTESRRSKGMHEPKALDLLSCYMSIRPVIREQMMGVMTFEKASKNKSSNSIYPHSADEKVSHYVIHMKLKEEGGSRANYDSTMADTKAKSDNDSCSSSVTTKPILACA